MSRPRLVLFAVFVAATLVSLAAILSVGTPSAEAAKPCWKRALDDWSDNGRMDDVYSQACIQAAIDNLPEDLRIYSNAPEIIGGKQIVGHPELPLWFSGGPTDAKVEVIDLFDKPRYFHLGMDEEEARRLVAEAHDHPAVDVAAGVEVPAVDLQPPAHQLRLNLQQLASQLAREGARKHLARQLGSDLHLSARARFRRTA